MKSFLPFAFAPLAAAVALSAGAKSPIDSSILERQVANPPVAAEPANFTFNELWALNKKFLDNFIYPADIKQAKAINSTLLAENVQGRIDITRTFNGRELNTEYLFGLFANLASASPGAISLLGVPLSYEVLHFAANQNVASALTRSVPLKAEPLELQPLNLHERTDFNSTSPPSTSSCPSRSTHGTPSTHRGKSHNTTQRSSTGNGQSTTCSKPPARNSAPNLHKQR